MKKFNKFIITFILILVGIVIYVLWKINSFTINIVERKYYNIDDILFYSDDLFDYKVGDGDKEKIVHNLKFVANYMSDNYSDVDVFISRFDYGDLDNTMYFKGCQMINNVVVADDFFEITIVDGKAVDFSFSEFYDFDSIKLDLNNLFDLQEANDKASELIELNRKQLGRVSNVDCEVFLIYTNNELIYKYFFNNGSYIDIDAVTGEVIRDYYFNGRYY